MLAGLKQKLPVIDFEAFKTLVTGIKNEGMYENLVLSGAEVTTFPDLGKYVRYAASLGWFKKIQIQTNGRRLSESAYLESLIDSGLNEFFISIQGLEETHDAITRTRGSFKETMEAVRNLGRFDVNVISNTVLTKTNFPDIVPLMALLSKEAFSEIHLWNFFPMESVDSRDLLVSMRDFRELLPQVLSSLKTAKKPFVLKNFPECLSIGENGFFDGGLPVTLIDEAYWRRFRENRFGSCICRDRCEAKSCWGLSGAYVRKFGDERDLVSPIKKRKPETDTGLGLSKGCLEYTTDKDVFFDYCLYRQAGSSIQNNRSVNCCSSPDLFKIHEKRSCGYPGRDRLSGRCGHQTAGKQRLREFHLRLQEDPEERSIWILDTIRP
jgi:MoaA/NifB/PqqE/SkfB family radical SAM enzyme